MTKDEIIAHLLDACRAAATSYHHPACEAPQGYPKKCTCHVQKCIDAITKAEGN